MKKRIMCLTLAVVMLMSMMFTGCDQLLGQGEDTNATGDIVEEQSNATKTLSMYMVCEAPVSEETAKLVEDAFNKITKSKFKTQVKLHFCTYDNYYETIEGVMDANYQKALLEEEAEKALRQAKRDAKALGIDTDKAWLDAFYEAHPEYAPFRETEALTGDDTTAEETELVTIEGTDSVMSQVKYPDERENQIDIIWLDSYDKYMEYVEKEWLTRLDDQLTSASKKLKEYINPTLLAWAKFAASGTYAIPNNVVIGEYTYLLVNKELAAKYSYDGAAINSIFGAATEDFLKDVATYEDSSKVVPIYGDFDNYRTFFWDIDTTTGKVSSDKFSIMGDTFTLARILDPASKSNSIISARNIFTSTEFKNQLYAIQKYKDAGYFTADNVLVDLDGDGKAEEVPQYAIRMVKGTAADLVDLYSEDYYMNVLEYPTIGYEEAFGNMLGVSSYTRDIGRSMEIITYLNTNSALRNILQYGVEGVHYQLDEETGALTRLNNDYMMDINTTGNVFVAYPEEGERLDIWEYGKKQNLDVRSYLALCFNIPEDKITMPEDEDDPENYILLNKDEVNELNEFSKSVVERLATVTSYEELVTLIEGTIDEETGDRNKDGWDDYKPAAYVSQITYDNDAGFFSMYYNWMIESGLYTPEE